MTHCKRGHEFTPENTAIDTKGARNCRACARLRAAETRARHRERNPLLPAVKLPAEPILKRVTAAEIVIGQDRTLEALIGRARNEGVVTLHAADVLCCRLLRVHPFEVYGDDWYFDIVEKDTTSPRHPTPIQTSGGYGAGQWDDNNKAAPRRCVNTVESQGPRPTLSRSA